MAGRIRGDRPALDARSLAQLKARSPSADDILDNMSGLNEEIAEQAAAKGVELAGPAQPEPTAEQTEELEDELDRINRELEAKLPQKSA